MRQTHANATYERVTGYLWPGKGKNQHKEATVSHQRLYDCKKVSQSNLPPNTWNSRMKTSLYVSLLPSFSVHPKMMFYYGLYMGVWYFIKPLPVGFEVPMLPISAHPGQRHLLPLFEVRNPLLEVREGVSGKTRHGDRSQRREASTWSWKVKRHRVNLPFSKENWFASYQVVVVNWLQVNFKWRTWSWGPLLCFMGFQFSTSRHSMFFASWPQTAFKYNSQIKGRYNLSRSTVSHYPIVFPYYQ